MPLIISIPQDQQSIDLKEFIETVESHNYDFTNQDDLINSAIYLNKLNNNKRFVMERIVSELDDLPNFQRSNKNGPNVFVLHKASNYLLRAVVWNPTPAIEENQKNLRYDIYHDHNFDLLTIGHFGPGYRTKCFTYNSEQTTGLLDEHVEMLDEGMFTLTEGRILLFKNKYDIHTQLPPDSLSVSLNIIPTRKISNYPQFQFNEQKSQISKYIHVSGNELVVRIAGVLGNKDDIEKLRLIMQGSYNEHIKAYAALSILQIIPTMSDEIEKWVYNSHNELMTDIFNRERKHYGSCV